ncbi:hypothetical protein EC960497_2988 [Escherichia coli 96.0497]|nr:conserved hypothetical protein [Escherichia coli B088]EGW68132.1 hypothetical protein ECSTECB2F1_2922 [Escherichia coli O91:H21 str. B2F1]EIH32995.1 hypothetical protein EC960497_2988 [Escherichia coli 96.0497]
MNILPVYPRWRGEHLPRIINAKYICGLSPLARGTRTRGFLQTPFKPVYPRWRGEHYRVPF